MAGLCLLGAGLLQAEPITPASPRLGINLAGPADWNTELPFVDVFRLSRPWISQRQGAPWGTGPDLSLDEMGWVRRLEPGCWAETLVCTIEGGHYPSGTYTLRYDGEGRLDASGAATIAVRAPGHLQLAVDATAGAMFIRLMETNPADPVRNIRVIMPGFEDAYDRNPFHPRFLQRWQGVACIRFMDWMLTNGSTVKTWSERPTPRHATFSARGVALETMIDLCNRLQTDAWFCMPHQADDDFVRRFATMVQDRLDPSLRAYVEYSNEVWNSMFAQTRYAQERGRELGLGPADRPWEGGGMYYARRSVEIFQLWEEVFESRSRLVRVLAWQSGNQWWMENIVLPHDNAFRHADALAIAPYIGLNVPLQGDGLTADAVAAWPLDQVFEHLETHALPASIQAIRVSADVARAFDLKLLAYEGGQHLVGIAGGQNSIPMTALFHQVNAHPRMGELYAPYFEAWEQAGGDLFCYFSSVSTWSKWGSWGALQYHDDTPAQSPKMRAILDWAKSRGQAVNRPAARP